MGKGEDRERVGKRPLNQTNCRTLHKSSGMCAHVCTSIFKGCILGVGLLIKVNLKVDVDFIDMVLRLNMVSRSSP